MVRTNIFLAILLLGSLTYAYCWHHLARNKLKVSLQGYELTIPPGASLHRITNQLHRDGVLQTPRLLRWYAIIYGHADRIQAGEYLIPYGTKPIVLLDILRSGNVRQHSFSIIEGQRVRDIILELQRHPKIIATLSSLTEDQIIEKINIPVAHLEGLLWPETYYFTAETKDVDFLRRAYLNMQVRLHDMWQERDLAITLQTPYEAIILASIIEKESGAYDEYSEISGVYHRRLQKRMRLQADPTVIYALGDKLEGPLLKKHLSVNSPYNTYQNAGLPPTPIAVPSIKAIHAALHPAPGESLYFVATGNGRHVFSNTLEEHNKAVALIRGS